MGESEIRHTRVKAALITTVAVAATPIVIFATMWLASKHPLVFTTIAGLGGLIGLWWILYGAVLGSLELRELRHQNDREH